MKKILCLILIILSVFTLLTACSSKEDIKEIAEKLPQNSFYISSTGESFSDGQSFPTPKGGDIFQYNGMKLGYERAYNSEKNLWNYSPDYKGAWVVYVPEELKNATIPQTINGIKVISPNK